MHDGAAHDERARERFSWLVSHAMRGATQSVVGALKLLADESSGEPLTPRQRTLIEAANAGASRLAQLSQDIQLLTHAEAQTLQVQPQTIPLTTVVREAIQRAQEPSAPDDFDPPREIRKRLSPAMPPLTCDPPLTVRALAAIIENALRFSPHDTPIIIESRKRRDWAIISVRDDGAGVTPADAERIFQPFITTRRASNQVGPGLGVGLGLTVARVCVEAQGGRLSLSAYDEPGATFTLELPLHS